MPVASELSAARAETDARGREINRLKAEADARIGRATLRHIRDHGPRRRDQSD